MVNSVLPFFNAEVAVSSLIKQTIALVRQAQEPKTMKDLLYCYDILILTDSINREWNSHPGVMFADDSAFQDLYKTAGCLMLYSDPSRDVMLKYSGQVKRLIHYWKLLRERGKWAPY